jgi:hypothetical protein
MNTTDGKAPDPAVSLARSLMNELISGKALDILELNTREKDAVIMRWEYGLTKEEMAKSFGLSPERTRQVYDKAMTKISMRLHRFIVDYPTVQQLKEENDKLKEEIKISNDRFKALTPEDKVKVEKADVRNKKITEIGLSKRVSALLVSASFQTVGDVMRADSASLFVIPGFGVKEMRQVEMRILRLQYGTPRYA